MGWRKTGGIAKSRQAEGDWGANMKAKAKDYDFKKGRFGGGFTIYPYQLSFGISFRYWPCIFAPTVRIHIGPFKLWLYIIIKSG